MNDSYLISETARLVGVESHVLRYWEEELNLPIRRNELGHRYYTGEDVERFRQIRKMKEQGLQLKAIRSVLTEGGLPAVLPEGQVTQPKVREEDGAGESDKGMRLQLLLQNLIARAVRENNEELVERVREAVLKEMDYQFRVQEEEQQKRERESLDRQEEHFKRLDALLREYSREKTGRERFWKKGWGGKRKKHPAGECF